MPFAPLIVIERDRVCHVCQLGSRLDERVIGALVVYVGLEGDILVRFGKDEQRTGRVVAVEAYRPHRIIAGRQFVCTVLVEPESVTEDSMDAIIAAAASGSLHDAALAGLPGLLAEAALRPGDLARLLGRHAFDPVIFNRRLESRKIDTRIEKVALLLQRRLDESVTVDSCANEIAVSTAHFSRLFYETTGVQFRLYRMWKRARAYLHHIPVDAPLSQIALDLGYPDSSHFSHSIRHTYGLPPRSMKSYMRESIFLTGGQSHAA